MKVIVSKTLEDKFTEFIVTDSLKKVMGFEGVTTLIIQSFIESDFDAGVFIGDLKKKGVDLFIYISENPSAVLQMVLKGVDGYYYEDEFYFEDEEELQTLISDIEEERQEASNNTSAFEAIATPALNTISTFMRGYVAGDKLVQTPLFLEQTNSAITELTNVFKQQELELQTMGNSALEVFEKASAIIRNMNEQKKAIEKQLEQLETVTSNSSSNKPAFGNSILFFSPYKYLGNSRVLVLKEYSPTRYLTSFVLGFAHYLHYVKNKRIKVIFCVQKGYCIGKRYEDYVSIDETTKSMLSLYDNEIIVTNSPKKEVMKELLSKPQDVVIVVDRLYGKEAIVTGRCTTLNVVSSYSDIQRYGLKSEDTITSVTKFPNCFACISRIKNYMTERDARLAAYHQVFGKDYEKICEYIHLNS